MVDPKAWLISLKRKAMGAGESFPKEVIKYPSAMERMEREGFKQIIKSDVLTARINDLKEELWCALQVVYGPYTDEEKGLAVDKAFTLTKSAASAWLRSMDNPSLHEMLIKLNQNFREWRPMPAFYDQIIEECSTVVDKGFSNIDVEPLIPIILWNWGQSLNPKNPNPPPLGRQQEK